MEYEEFKGKVFAILMSNGKMTWTEIREEGGIPQEKPPHEWVHRLEEDIFLQRESEGGSIYWDIVVSSEEKGDMIFEKIKDLVRISKAWYLEIATPEDYDERRKRETEETSILFVNWIIEEFGNKENIETSDKSWKSELYRALEVFRNYNPGGVCDYCLEEKETVHVDPGCGYLPRFCVECLEENNFIRHCSDPREDSERNEALDKAVENMSIESRYDRVGGSYES